MPCLTTGKKTGDLIILLINHLYKKAYNLLIDILWGIMPAAITCKKKQTRIMAYLSISMYCAMYSLACIVPINLLAYIVP